MSNICHERYQCNECCKDTYVWLKLSEFSIFAQAWLDQGKKVIHLESKRQLGYRGKDYAQGKPDTLIYASNRSLEEHRESGKYGNTQTLAIFTGLCANNDPDTGFCTIEDEKPKDCKDFEFEGNRCHEIRGNKENKDPNFIPLSDLL